jgi:sporulation protein YtfJ
LVILYLENKFFERKKKMHPIEGLMQTAMQKIKDMTDVETIIGEPIKVSDNVTIIPVSKVSFGFASGGSDFPSKQQKDLFGGGSGGGISINPIAFLVIKGEEVKILQLSTADNTAEKAINMVPEVIDKVSELFKGSKSK